MTSNEFEKYCKEKVAQWHNTMVAGIIPGVREIESSNVFMTWFVKVADKKKGLFGVDIEGDNRYYEFTEISDTKIVMDVYDQIDKETWNPQLPSAGTVLMK